MVVGIIPGPSEPSKNINSYLDPLVTDLKQLWTGVTVKINGRPTAIRLHFLVLRVMCQLLEKLAVL